LWVMSGTMLLCVIPGVSAAAVVPKPIPTAMSTDATTATTIRASFILPSVFSHLVVVRGTEMWKRHGTARIVGHYRCGG
jgi:hypothetical protein